MRGFGDLEAAVMQQIWDFAAPTTVRQVYTELIRDRTLAYTTVLSVMGKLCRKGFLQREREARHTGTGRSPPASSTGRP